MKACEIVKPIEEFAPLSGQENWDNCGFSVGDPQMEATAALLALDCTEEVLDEAIGKGINLIITHHPLIFGGVKKISPQTGVGRMIIRAIRHGVAVYSAHTNMDKAAGGVSAVMADKLNLRDREILTPDGYGLVGNLPDSLPADELAHLLKARFPQCVLRTSRPLEEKIGRVAVCGGSGRQFIPDAMGKGAQVYITGDITYHEFYTENGFMIMDIGHYSSEYDIVRVFSKILCEKFPTFAVSVTERNNNPIYYY